MHLVIRLPTLLRCLAAPLALHFLTTWISGSLRGGYASFSLPGFAPNAATVELLRLLAYVLLSLSSYLIGTCPGLPRGERASSLTLYGFVLIGSSLWSILLLRFRFLLLAAAWAVVVLGVAGLCAALFYRIRKSAGLLMLPALAWLGFAAALSFSISILN